MQLRRTGSELENDGSFLFEPLKKLFWRENYPDSVQFLGFLSFLAQPY